MRLRLFVLVSIFALLVGACGGAATPSPSTASSQPSASAPASGGGSASPAASGGAVDITATKYKAEAVGNKGGNLVIGISGDPSSIWFTTYDTFANDCEAFCPSFWSLWNNTNDLKYYPQLTTEVPTLDNGGVKVNGDKMDVTVKMIPGAKWSDGE